MPLRVKERIILTLQTGDTSNLAGAFIWSDTPQGHDYWREVRDSGQLTDESRVALEGLVGIAPSNTIEGEWEVLEEVGATVPETPETPEVEENKSMYMLVEARLVDGRLNFIARPDRYGAIVGEPTVEKSEDRLVNTFQFKVDSYWLGHMTFHGHCLAEDSFFRAVVKTNESGEYEAFGELNSIEKGFGFKTVGDFYTFMLKLFNYETHIGEDLYLWAAREVIEMCMTSGGCEVYDYSAALSSVFYYRPLFTEEGVSLYMNVRDFERNRRSKTTIGRFLRKILPQFNDSHIEKAVDKFNRMFMKRNFVLKRGASRRDFDHAYNGKQAEMLNPRTDSSRKSLANSCMRNMHIDGMSPAEVFASGDFEILWLEDENGKIGGRVVVYLRADGVPQAGPIYGVCEHSLDLLQAALEEMGAKLYDSADWTGARLLSIPVYDSSDLLMIYCDMAEEGYWDGEYIYLEHRNSNISVQTTEGYISSHHRCSCCECGDSVHEDEVYTNEDGYEYCSFCYNQRYTNCAVTGYEILRDDSFNVLTSQHQLYYRASVQNPGEITVGDDVGFIECFYTDEYWLAEDAVQDVDGNDVSPRYAENNLTEVDGVYYTSEQLLREGLDEEGNPLDNDQQQQEEEEKEEAA